MSVGMHHIQTGRSSDFIAIYSLVSRNWPHGVEARPLASPGTGFWPPSSLLWVGLGPYVGPASAHLPSVHLCSSSQPHRLQSLHHLLHTGSDHLWSLWWQHLSSDVTEHLLLPDPGCPRGLSCYLHKHCLGEQRCLHPRATQLGPVGGRSDIARIL